MNSNAKQVALEIAENEAAIEGYRDREEVECMHDHEDLVMRLAEVLTPVLIFIARGRRGGTMGHRAWVIMHEVRLDLISAESISAYAKEAGVSEARIFALIREFRDAVPAYRGGPRKSEDTRARMSAAAQGLRKL